MLRFSANLSMLYAELPFLDRFEAAAKDGFKGVEYLGPYEEEPRELAAILKSNDLKQVLFNLPSGDWAGGERGIGCLPDRRKDFAEGVEKALVYAKALDCPQVNCLAGIAPKGAARKDLEDVLVENLRMAAPKFAAAGVKLLIEPINYYDIPGFLLNTSADGERILDRVGSDNLFIQYDFYHMQRMQGELVANFQRLQSRIAHVQIADNPGRNEPGTGEINYGVVFSELARLGYDGWVGAEYKPKGQTSAGLGWLAAAAKV
jgi:hydroxypyruvate isomerase